MPDRFERAVSGTLAVVAVVMAVAFVHREFGSGSRTQVVRNDPKPPEMVTAWKDLLDAGVLVGDSAAPVKVVEFADFECPFCRRFELSFRAAKKQFGRNVALVFVHFPLPMHRFAIPAARAAECAREHGRFAEFREALYDKQDSLGLKAWASYARDVGIRDTVEFAKCNSGSATVAQIAAGQTLATKLGVRATPTVVINGWRFYTPPSDSALAQIVAAALAGSRELEAFVTKRQ
jgi:protein-disulfide isomerase